MLFNFKEFDVDKRAKLCKNLENHPWFNTNEGGQTTRTEFEFNSKNFNFQQISPVPVMARNGLEICSQNHSFLDFFHEIFQYSKATN